MTETDLYRILCLEPGACRDEVKAAYRCLSKKYHPDSTGDPATSERFSRVVNAYRILEVSLQKDSYLSADDRGKYRPVSTERADVVSLGEMLQSGASQEVRISALRKLGFSGMKSAYAYVRKALYDPDEAVVRAAVQAVAVLGVRQSAGEMAAVFSRSSPSLKASILATAGATGEGLFSATLEAALTDTDPSVSSRARGLLASMPFLRRRRGANDSP
jgi:curved DNA-binding protein CbpA